MEAAVPSYFELSWGILSTIGLINFFNGLMVLGIIGFAPVCLVPIVVSAAAAAANGLCYVAYYTDYTPQSRAVAAALADFTWLIEEAGLSFYGYIILFRLLQGRRRTVFISCFWILILVVTVTRFTITSFRVRSILDPTDFVAHERIISRLHNGYFGGIAVVECLTAGFLLSELRAAVRTSNTADLGGGVSEYLFRSTEVRLATLAFIGVLRTITYNFQDTAQSATSPANQLDRFAATLEVLFPIVMYIDILASRLAYANGCRHLGRSRSEGMLRDTSRVRHCLKNNPRLSTGAFHVEDIENNPKHSASSFRRTSNLGSITERAATPSPGFDKERYSGEEIKPVSPD